MILYKNVWKELTNKNESAAKKHVLRLSVKFELNIELQNKW